MDDASPAMAGRANDMGGEEFAHALEVVGGWVQRYRERVGELPVLAQVRPGEVREALPVEPPEGGDGPEQWVADLDRIVVPALTHWNHPGFMAYFGITGSAPGILADLVSSVMNVNGMLWKTSPALTELEEVMVGWYARALGLPPRWFGMIADTASTSTLVALAAAREAAGVDVRDEGLSGGPRLVVYCSEEAHSSVEKAAIVLGIGRKGVRHIPSDEAFRMRPGALEEAIRADLEAERRPFAVVATVGTTSATAVDPVPELAAVCRRYGLWLHVDAAYAGSAAVAPEFRWALAGCDQADSLVANPHKWMFTPIDCSVLFTARPDVLRQALSLVPEYLRTDASGVTDLMDYSFQLGRRFRALKLWFVFRHFGTRGMAAIIREHVRIAGVLRERVDAHPNLERMAPANFSVVCFRVRPPGVEDEAAIEEANACALEHANASGEVFISHTKLKGRYCLRVAVGNLGTSEERALRVLDLVCEATGLDPALE